MILQEEQRYSGYLATIYVSRSFEPIFNQLVSNWQTSKTKRSVERIEWSVEQPYIKLCQKFSHITTKIHRKELSY